MVGNPSKRKREQDGEDPVAEYEVVCLQPTGIIDHACLVNKEYLSTIKGELGGSERVSPADISDMLSTLGEFTSKAGGSAANTARGLAQGFAVKTGMFGSVGNDEWGGMFTTTMKRAGVNTNLMKKAGTTGRCVCLVSSDEKGQRTMRPCISQSRIKASEVDASYFQGAKYFVLNGYAFYEPDLPERAVELAKENGCKVCLDLASFEVVRAFRERLEKVLSAGQIDVIMANEDEANAMMQPEEGDHDTKAQHALQGLSQWCDIAVITLGDRGCILKAKGEDPLALKAVSNIKVVDTTGAGDVFAAGFLYGLLRGLGLQRCAEIANLAGAAVCQSLGAEVSDEHWKWFHSRLHGEKAGAVVRDSAEAVHRELLECYELIERLGRGVVYYGSARLKKESLHYQRSVELATRVSQLLEVTTWSGGGPGMMQAASEGAMQAGYKVGGIRIMREAGTTVLTSQGYLPVEAQVMCRFLSSRKVALVDSGVRAQESDRTAYIFLPGGLGTMDEFFEILTLMQLKKLGTKHSVPVILLNYDGVFDGLTHFVESMMQHGTVGAGELDKLVVHKTNDDVINYLKEFYKL